MQYRNGTESQNKEKGIEGERKEVCCCLWKGEHGETGFADKEAALLIQATYLLQKATDIRARGKKCIEEN